MKNLKRLGVAFALTFVLGVAAFAGEVSAPPCAPPAPGEVNAPPCSGGQMTPDDSTAPGDVQTPPASNTVDIFSVVDAAMNLLLLF